MSKVKIGEVCFVYDGPHATPTKLADGPIYLGIDAVTENGRLNPAEYNHLSEEDYKIWTKRVTPQQDDIVFSYEATLGRYAMIPKGFYGCLGRRLAIVRVKDSRVNPKWLYYYFQSPEWTVFIANHTVRGSTVDRISVEDFPNYMIPLPSRDIQDAIVNVLSQIDMRFDNNMAICAELESMAKTIYDYWFTQFDFPDANGKPYRSSGGVMVWNEQLKCEIPTGWTATTISALTTVLTGKEDANFSMPNGNYKFFTCAQETIRCDFPAFSGHAVLIAGNGDFNVKHYSGQFNAYQRTYVLIPKDDKYYAAMYIAAQQRIQAFKQGSNGSIVKFITKSDVENIPILIPTDDSLFEPLNCFLEKIEYCERENDELTKLRNWLLPMLMNGQATVADAEEEVSKVIPFEPRTVEVRQAARNFGDKKIDDTADLVKAYVRRKKDDQKP